MNVLQWTIYQKNMKDRSAWRSLCNEAVTQFKDERVAVLQHKHAVHKQEAHTIIEQPRHLALWSLFEDLLFQNWTVHSPTHSSITRTIDPLTSTAQSMCVCDIYYVVRRQHTISLSSLTSTSICLMSFCSFSWSLVNPVLSSLWQLHWTVLNRILLCSILLHSILLYWIIDWLNHYDIYHLLEFNDFSL